MVIEIFFFFYTNPAILVINSVYEDFLFFVMMRNTENIFACQIPDSMIEAY